MLDELKDALDELAKLHEFKGELDKLRKLQDE